MLASWILDCNSTWRRM